MKAYGAAREGDGTLYAFLLTRFMDAQLLWESDRPQWGWETFPGKISSSYTLYLGPFTLMIDWYHLSPSRLSITRGKDGEIEVCVDTETDPF